ncbi:3 beta-hydroxysteroid dehydrogenase/Delta 5--_4-isomerase type 4-like [Pecten maximus]|uniref:3 beta-hydroxysteroid dehydrogenase/Delta 5-->4-isomerase type 4-like n=1 Tax=Pecten maximus TaxID=6579 RepID=UPI0014583D34|nr:3 beta-hydroxysteroid dehydrogenase/Delta 5-->4-isomerase type 4-like [Pecten maximus]
MDNISVLVTGGNGFLGQHILKHLHLAADDLHLSEIRVLDLVPYKNRLDYKPTRPVKVYEGNLLDEEEVRRACKGVEAVLHIASYIDTKLFPNTAKLDQVNVTGTQSLIDISKEEGVSYFIYCSSVSCVQGYTEVLGGTESTLTLLPEDKLLFRCYGSSKQKAMKIVLDSNGDKLQHGDDMRTMILVPTTMYGELDQGCFTLSLKVAYKNKGCMPKSGSDTTLCQFGYVGNIAWGFVCGLKTLIRQPDLVAGQQFLLSDDTPIGSLHKLQQQFLECRGMKYTTYKIPDLVMYFMAAIITILGYILYPIYTLDSNFTYSGFHFIQTSFYIKYQKAKDFLSYTPLYSAEESLQAAKQYYSTMDLG